MKQADWLKLDSDEAVEALPDETVLKLSKLKFTPAQQRIFSDLPGRNREGELDDEGRRQLDEFMNLYERGTLLKSRALRVAVQRGLRKPLRF
jgi:hypothetical protein